MYNDKKKAILNTKYAVDRGAISKLFWGKGDKVFFFLNLVQDSREAFETVLFSHTF